MKVSTLCRLLTFVLASLLSTSTSAEVKLSSIFGDHMVLQQGQTNLVWGKSEPGEKVIVSISDQQHSTTAGDDGKWEVKLQSLPVGGPHELKIKGKNTITYKDVLVGEVWICSGQSNMAWAVNHANDPELEKLTANFENIRLISVPQLGVQQPQDDFDGQWSVCSPETVGDFSAVGYFFGRQLHQTLNVPIGLIDNAWGGSAAEAWIRRDVLEEDERFKELMTRWKQTEANHDHEKQLAEFRTRLKRWDRDGKIGNRPRPPRNPLTGNHRPANIYCGVLHPTIGYGIRGAIWYQGESNASRAYQYRDLFPLMIQHWRDEWGQGDFPFYWVQLADFQEETAEPQDSAWAELREAQTMTMSKLPNTGQAVITNLGEAHDIHPRNKQDVAKRLARWALARDYGIDICFQSPLYKSMEREGNKIMVKFDVGEHELGALDTFDVRTPIGFTIAGNDKKFVHAKAKITDRNRVEVWSDEVGSPAAVRYAWADNPVCNLQNRAGLPATPFRTDDWLGVTFNDHRNR